MKDKTAFCQQAMHRNETALCECLSLLVDAHVEVGVLHAIHTGEVIADEVPA